MLSITFYSNGSVRLLKRFPVNELKRNMDDGDSVYGAEIAKNRDFRL